MSLYGSGLYGSGFYGGTTGILGAFQGLVIPVRIMVYDRNGTFKGVFQSGACSMLGVSFGHVETGCGDFSIEFAESVDIEKSDMVVMFLLDSLKRFYTGVVRSVPIEGSTSQVYVYAGFGLNDYFQRVNAESLSYVNKTLTFIVNDLVDDVIVAKTPITKSVAKISLPNITMASFTINYSQVGDVLAAIKAIADSGLTEYVYGVDQDGDFFFMERSDDTVATLFVGKRGAYGIPTYEPEDEEEQRTKLFVLKSDGTYYTTITSGGANDIYEERLKGPDIDDVSLGLYAQGYLAKMERATRSASVEWKIEERSPQLVVADGNVRVLSNIPISLQRAASQGLHFWGVGFWNESYWGGEPYLGYNLDDTLSIRAVEYSITNDEAMRTLTLGALPAKIESAIADIYRNMAKIVVNLEA